MTGNRQSAKESFFDSSWIIRLTNSALFSRNARQIYEGNYALSSLFCKPNHSPRTLVSLPLLFSLFSFYSHFAAPPQTSSREVCPSFSSRPHPTSVRSDTFQITRSIVVARYSSKVTSIDKHRFSWYRGKWTPSFGFGSASACREWSRSSCAMVDRVVDASNAIYFPRGNGMEIEMRSWTYFSIYLNCYYIEGMFLK